MIIETGGYKLICDEVDNELIITSYEGAGAILNISDDDRIIGIDKKAFLCCRALKKVFLPGSIKYIGDWSFSKCDNIHTVRIGGPARGHIFGKGVFDGCESLKEIVFENDDTDQSILLAASVSCMNKEHLLRADDIGDKFWYEKWDISLLSLLHSEEAVSGNGAPMGGEEDISYDGVSSVDGEMPGPQKNHVKSINKNKCILCYMRLLHNRFLSSDTEDKIRTYIKDRAYGCNDDMAWITLKEDYIQSPDRLSIYLSTVNPDRTVIIKMIDDIGSDSVQLKAALIDASGATDAGVSALDDLMI